MSFLIVKLPQRIVYLRLHEVLQITQPSSCGSEVRVELTNKNSIYLGVTPANVTSSEAFIDAFHQALYNASLLSEPTYMDVQAFYRSVMDMKLAREETARAAVRKQIKPATGGGWFPD